MFLYHYFEKENGPFLSLSDLSVPEAKNIQDSLIKKGEVCASQRNDKYLERRVYLEQLIREMFIGECPWLLTWYKNGDYIKIPICEFDLNTVSFTYGDTFPTFSPKITDNLEFRNKVYLYDEILKIIEKYGLPQDDWEEPVFAKPCYVEAQIWSDDPILRFRKDSK